ncbi:hypothetical protein KQX54_002233 [Cotesia glomerata]|uniref:Uncharacterized protein n=1 Tax=Cotesia glomerata TaxID=32391 RepID=A0AAV7I177_COTGL|nr:hypothetical protein KQX54_002233 [Cotesia glomerata]
MLEMTLKPLKHLPAPTFPGIVTKFLSHPIYLPFSRVSYSIYLLHLIIQGIRVYSMRTPIYFTESQMTIIIIGDVVTSFLAAIIFSLVFESPFVVLEKLIFSRKKPINQPTEPIQEEITFENGIINHGFGKQLNYLFFYGILISKNDVCEVFLALCFDRTNLGIIWMLACNTLGSVLMPLLIYGTLKEDYKFMMPFLVFELIRIILETLVFTFWIVRLLINDFSEGFYVLVIGMIVMNTLAYFWLVLYNRKEEIKIVNPPSCNKSVKPYEVNC